MKRQVRIALIVLIAALAIGWLGLRRNNDALERLAAGAPSAPAATTGAAAPGGTP